MKAYKTAAHTLLERIYALIPEHPEILSIDNPFDLYKIKEFNCTDLQPSLAQASWALDMAKHLWNNKVD